MTEKDVVDQLVPLFDDIENLNEDVKAIVKAAKKAGLDGTALSKIAKAKSAQKLNELKDDTSNLLTMIETFI